MADQDFLAILDEIRALHEKKSADYGAGQDPYANINASAEFGIPPWLGAMLRGNDKMARIKSFANKGVLENESLEDAFIDLATYSVIALTLYRRSIDTSSKK